jgi:hypothetical protein
MWGIDWIPLAQETDKWLAHVTSVMNFEFQKIRGFLE